MKLFTKDESMSRSEKLRQKRQPAVQSRSDAPAAPSVRNEPDSYRVVTRRAETSASNRQAVGTQPRRKVVYAVGANGVETRLPALPILRFNWQWVSGILTMLILMFIIILINSPIFRVNAFEVYGLTTYSSADFEPLLNGKQSSIFMVDTEEILDRVLINYPELMGSQVGISLPNRIVINASERKPVVLWHSDAGDYWIDAEGVVLAPRGEVNDLLTINSPVSPPLLVERQKPANAIEYIMMVFEQKSKPVDPSERAALIRPGMMEVAAEMFSHMPEGGILMYDPISGMGWRDPGGWEVYFGNDLSHINLKLVMYHAILERLESIGVTPVFISVEHIDAPFYRTE